RFRHQWEWAFLDSLRQPHLVSLEHGEPVTALKYSPDGRHLASAGTGGAVRLWDAVSWRVVAYPGNHGASVPALVFDPAGSLLATAGRGDVKVWALGTGRELSRLPGSLWAAFSPDGRHLASARGDVTKVWEARTGREVFTLPEPMDRVHHGAFSPD